MSAPARDELSLFEAVCAGSHIAFKGELVVAASLLALYADESGIHGAAPHCVLAGYVASTAQWKSFDCEWKRAFRKLPYPISEFHAKYYFPRGGDYRKYNVPEQECRDLLDRLLTVIETHNLHAFGVGVDVPYFTSLTWGERAWLTGGRLKGTTLQGGAPSRPYHLCFNHAIFEAIKLAKPGKRIDFFFAQQRQFMGLAAQHFDTISDYLDAHRRKKIGTIAFPSASEVSALQAADLLANCCYSLFVNREAMPKEKQYAFLRCRKDLSFKGWAKDTFDTLFAGHFKAEGLAILRAMEPPPNRKKDGGNN
jgi:uncharacterized protein DUF3800